MSAAFQMKSFSRNGPGFGYNRPDLGDSFPGSSRHSADGFNLQSSQLKIPAC